MNSSSANAENGMNLVCGLSSGNLITPIIYIIILSVALTSCSESKHVDLAGNWSGYLTIDFCGKEYVEKSKLEFISEGNRIIKIKQTFLNGIDFSRNDPESCEDYPDSDTYVIRPENLPKIADRNDLQQFLSEWDGMEAAYSYSIKKFSKKELVIRAVLSANSGDIQTRIYTR
jgi:hypothetical protein